MRLIIEPSRTDRNYWRDLWRYRELFAILAWRDVTVRYKQTVAGAGWALIQPLLAMVVMTVIFGTVARLPSQADAPYAVMVFAAMLPWQLFASALATSSQSIVSNANLISKVYFPRLIVPASAIVVALVDFLIACSILAGLMLWYHIWPTWRLLAIPPLLVFAVAATWGPGLVIAALTVRYRDMRFITPFLIQFGLYLSPVAYSSEVIRNRFSEAAFLVYSLNPMVGVIDGFRWAILGGGSEVSWPGFTISALLTVVLLVAGVTYFRRTERTFADVI